MQLESSAFVSDQELIKALEHRSTLTCCDEDRILFRQGEAPTGLYILNKGEALLSARSTRARKVVSIRAAAALLLGLHEVIGNAPCTHTAIARPGAEFRFVKRNDFTGLIRSDPRLPILQILASEIRSLRRAILQLQESCSRRPSPLEQARDTACNPPH